MASQRELFIELFNMLHENYMRETEISRSLSKYNITVDDESNPLVAGIEHLIDTYFDFDDITLSYIYSQCYPIDESEPPMTAEEVCEEVFGYYD